MIAPPQRRKAATLITLLLLGTAVRAAELCTPAPPLRIAAAPRAITEQFDWSGQRFSSNADGDTELSGDVVVKFGDREIRSQRLRYDIDTNSIQVDGEVVYRDPTIQVEGNAGSYGNANASFSGARFKLLQQAGRGTAESVSMTGGNEVDLVNVAYTTCPEDATDWELRARRIHLDLDRMRGIGRGARVEFKGVPILYLPWISFPLSSQRQTGLLFPMLGSSSRNGATLSVPWYWNIAPNQDLTLTPTIYSERGLDVGVEYRLLQQQGRGTVRMNYLPHDRAAHRLRNEQLQLGQSDEDLAKDARSYQYVNVEWQLPADWRLRLLGENASDPHYFEDFAQGLQASSTAFLSRQLQLAYSGDIWRLRGEFLNFQTLDTSLPLAERPYTELPRLTARGRWDAGGGLRATLDTEMTGFTRSVGDEGWRARVTPALAWPLTGGGYYLRPSLAWDFTGYQLGRIETVPDKSVGRSVPLFNIDAGLQLERPAGKRANRVVTLEPRMLYVYIPYRDQSRLPVFDSGLPDPNFVSLFRSNRYVGGDRIGDANNLTLGVTTRMYEAATGQQYLSATFGQSYHLETPRVTLPGETVDTNRRSNLVANVDLRAYRNFSVRTDVAWNPERGSPDKTYVALQYQLASNKVANLGYRYDRDSVSQLDASAAWPVGRRWELYARSVYSLRDRSVEPARSNKWIENFAGVRYRGDCWGIRAVLRRSITRPTDPSTTRASYDTGFYVQLELTGLSSVGTGADTFLQQSIQGYSAGLSNREQANR